MNIKRNTIKNLSVLLLLIFAFGIFYHFITRKAIPVFKFLSNSKIITIDPGHGTCEQGVVHKETGITESPINLAVSLKIKKLLQKQGFTVIMTRERENHENISSREDLKRRVDIARSHHADIFVSIHVNQFPDPKYFGAQCFFNPKNAESRSLAQIIQEELKLIDPENFREALPQDLYVLRETSMPAVLVEMGFISNTKDRKRLQDPHFQDKIAYAVVRGIQRFFSNDTSKNPPVYE